MNVPIYRLFFVFLLLFAVLVGFTSRWAVFGQQRLRENPENARVRIEEQQIKRGVILTYLLIAERGFKTATLATDSFSKLLATGLTAVMALQVFVIVGGVTRVIPLTGVTLPFVSYGGSSIVANFILLGLLLAISNRARQPAS